MILGLALRNKGSLALRLSAAARIILAVEQYHAKSGEYPETLSECPQRRCVATAKCLSYSWRSVGLGRGSEIQAIRDKASCIKT